MPSTPLHHKPIVYGSPLADALFLALVVVHILPAVVAPVSAIVALATRKGAKLHVRAGRLFVWSMASLAVTGIALDVVRLGFYVRENHTKYAGYSMPSTYPARIAFLFAALTVLWVLWVSTPPRVFRRAPAPSPARALFVPSLLVALGLALSVLILVRFSPWNGSLWMIGTFSVLVVVAAAEQLRAVDRASGVARHRFGMTFLAAFSWWGFLQGFGPAIGIAIRGPDLSTAPYVGNQPGPYAPYFWFFLIGWAPIFALGAFLVRRFRRRAALATFETPSRT